MGSNSPLRRAARRRDRGFGALELILSIAVFASIFASLSAVLRSSASSALLQRNSGSVFEKGRQVVDGLARELRWAQTSTLLVTSDSGSSRLDFRVPTGFTNGATTWSSTITVKYAKSHLDADGDHVQDEGALIRTQDGKSRVLCDYVPSGGFTATLTGSSLAVSLRTSVVDATGRTSTATAAKTVSTRN